MKHQHLLGFALAAATLGGCLDGDDVGYPEAPSDSAATRDMPPEYAPLAPGAVDTGPDVAAGEGSPLGESEQSTGRIHVVRVQTPWGEAEIEAVERADGSLLHDGDMVVGNVAELGDRSAFITSLNNRYPDGIVPFIFDTTWNAADPTDAATMQRIRLALDQLAQRTPLRFVDRVAEPGYISINNGDHFEATLGFNGTPQRLMLNQDATTDTIMHEAMHSVGVWHEQSRPDAADFVTVFPECIQAGQKHAFRIETTASTVGTFDWDSVMLYGSWGFCKPDVADANGNGNVTECGFHDAAGTDKCYPMEHTGGDCPAGRCSDVDGDGWPEYFSMPNRLSTGDINGLYAMYGRSMSINEKDDRLGATLAVGDFDADGHDDLAVGAPGEAPGNQPASGVVFVYKGTPRGFQPWKVLRQDSKPVLADGTLGSALGANQAQDQFGAALAVGDFDGNGVDDLAVGLPGQAASATRPRVGAVLVFTGHANRSGDARHGLNPWRIISQTTLGAAREADDAFGQVLAAGDFDGNGFTDLAVASPGEAPPNQPSSGVVYLIKGGSTMTAWHALGEAGLGLTQAAGDQFGASLAVGNLNGDAAADLVVGIPNRTVGTKAKAGAVAFYLGGATVEPLGLATAPSPAASARLGAAVVVGDLDGSGTAEVVASAPGDHGGRLLIYRGTGSVVPALWKNYTQGSVGAGDEIAGDDFGHTLVIGDVDGDGKHDIVVGASGERLGTSTARSGQAVVLLGTGSSFAARDLITQAGISDDDDGDGFGMAIALTRIPGSTRPRLMIGSPGEDLDAAITTGAVLEYGVGPFSVQGLRSIFQSARGTNAQ